MQLKCNRIIKNTQIKICTFLEFVKPIYKRVAELHIETDVRRVVFIIETKNEKDNNALETVRSLFSGKTKDFITAVDEKNIILVKELKPNETRWI